MARVDWEFKPNGWVLGLCVKLRILNLTNSSKGPKFLETGTWVWAVLQSSTTVFISWILANWFARTGWRNASPDLAYDDWWLQGGGVFLNLAIAFCILCGQLLRFSLWAASRYPLLLSLGKGIAILIAIGFIGITAVFMLSPEIKYPLWINTPFDFSLVWILLSSVLFPGAAKSKTVESVEI